MDELNLFEKLVVYGGVILVIYLGFLQYQVVLKRRRRKKRHEAHKRHVEAHKHHDEVSHRAP